MWPKPGPFQGQAVMRGLVLANLYQCAKFEACSAVYLVPLMSYLTFEISSPWNLGQGSLKVIGNGTIRNLWYHFLLVFYSSGVNKTFFSKPRPRPSLWVPRSRQDQRSKIFPSQDQDQDQDFFFKTKTKTLSLVSTRTTLKRNISICHTSKWQ